MSGRSSSKQGSKGGMELDRIDNPKEEPQPHLSGAYIRSLVKQLTSSRTRDHPMMMNPKDRDPRCSSVDGNGFSAHKNLSKFGDGDGDGGGDGDAFSTHETQQLQPPQQTQHHKKQVRRRLHTSRPYQERLLNMAEARREIVTALKFHRAAMKQAKEQPQPQPQQPQPQPQPQAPLEQEVKLKSRRNPRIYPSNTASFSNYADNLTYSTFAACPPPPDLYSWPAAPIAPAPTTENLNLNLSLPNQALGLNLNFHDFSNLDTTLYHNSDPSSIQSFSFPSSSSFSVASTEDAPSDSQQVGTCGLADVADSGGLGLHPAMDDEEMAEIRSIGEQHEMEWNDTLNLVTSAWWFKFMKTMEIGPEEKTDEDDGYRPFPFDHQLMEFPAWLNANDCCLQPHFNDHSSHDPALPCMDIGEIEGMDGEWLA
ncbi:hypothetical protein F0562_003059 [Nyssa sinensis]|uniref:Hydroxyproline-rich glycoprotein family protein n=1 Tax=Nyssa sinensis TaxID=561372 RepID=A0A5J5BX76_9ASTE|nr:hypothetical protein F0562_003059 [Nyssa sinensis]